MDDSSDFIRGIYERIINRSLEERLDRVQDGLLDIKREQVDLEESADALTLHVAKLIAHSLASIKGDDKTRRLEQVSFCNQLLEVIAKHDVGFQLEGEKILDDLKMLLEIRDSRDKVQPRPSTPLARGALFTGTSSDLTLEGELRKELLTADRIDILCSFIKWSGLRLILQELKEATSHGKELRVITTSYMGATDLEAVEELAKLPNTTLLVSYDTKRTRLHAKSYIFHRENGFGTAYVGSSNLSNPALTSGLEWNLKLSQFESPYLWEKVCATFETYQMSSEFIAYDATAHDKLAHALLREHGSDHEESMTFMDLAPYPYQEEILDQLRAERELHGRRRNLVVAATGTGKTVIAAFDFKRIKKNIPQAKFLFVVHREEILKASRHVFRNILRDQNFGDLLVGSERPASYEQLFVSIQSLNSHHLCKDLPADYYDYIVVDEFHHAAARGYQELLEHFQPKYLLGLTATPERHDGLDVLKYFGYHVAAEIRLPDAINRKLLCPFQYFGVSDCVDLSGLTWRNGGYDKGELNACYCGNWNRASLVLQKMREILLNISSCRALCFCVSQDHAGFMNRYFTSQGVRSAVLTAQSSPEERNGVQRRLRERSINVICVVDLYNEGIDIPEIDTILFLRPTESLTVFLQQLGRGLRLHEDKECLTVLDFVGNAHNNFSFEYRFKAMLGPSSRHVKDEVEDGFPHLPAGCHIVLEKEAKQRILNNIAHAIHSGRKAMVVARIAQFEHETGLPLTLENFVDYHRLDLEVLYSKGLFARLCQLAGRGDDFQEPDEESMRKGLRRLCHWNSVSQLCRFRELLTSGQSHGFSVVDERLLSMFHYCLWGSNSSIGSLSESLDHLRANSVCYGELLSLLAYLSEHATQVTASVSLPYVCPLELHANYSRDEILAALGYWTVQSAPDVREGVKYLSQLHTDVLFVTLNKSERQYSPTTMYLDYAINEELFHWQSQSTTSVESATGRRYVTNGSTVLLFVRENKSRHGQSCSYCYLGPAICVSHKGSKPISITWKLKHKMPARICRITERMATA